MRQILFVLFTLPLLAAEQPSGAQPQQPEPLYQSVVITAKPVDPAVELRNAEIFNRTLFSRDDQIFHLLDAGISLGQHEGGGKSLEVRRFGFNLDHGGVSGGLKILVDDVPQNQTTQGHGQGYLGSLKSLSPELVQEVQVHNGPFRAEYGDFSGLGVVHILLRESLPDQFTARVQGGSFNTKRGFIGFSPDWKKTGAVVAYEGSHTNGPFVKPLAYRRDNFTANLTRRRSEQTTYGFKLNAARNDFFSPGQLPLDEVFAGRLDRFGFLDPGDGGHFQAGTAAGYLRRETPGGRVWRLDGFTSRSLFDLYSNFTFLLNDPDSGDGIQQHDSRLQQGANLNFQTPHRWGSVQGLLSSGGNFHANQILVGMYSRVNRTPTVVNTLAHANVTNGAGFLQDQFSAFQGRLQFGGGLRYDVFRFTVDDRVASAGGGQTTGLVQPKANLAWTPSLRLPMTLHVSHGRGFSSLDARGVVRSAGQKTLATTDFYQAGVSHRLGRASFVASAFWIDRSNELVYIPDDGSIEFFGPTRSYGYEAKASVEISRRLSLHGGATKVSNTFYRATDPRQYVDRAPHLTLNGSLLLSGWRGWSASVRLRAINGYRLDPEDAGIRASGHTLTDLGISRRIRRGVELQIQADNLTNRRYWETQNYFESQLPGQGPLARVHATPGYPFTLTVGLNFRFRGK